MFLSPQPTDPQDDFINQFLDTPQHVSSHDSTTTQIYTPVPTDTPVPSKPSSVVQNSSVPLNSPIAPPSALQQMADGKDSYRN